MIKDDYCNFETAKLLKEKGFDGECKKYYNLKMLTNPYYGSEYVRNRNLKDENDCIAPTLQMAMKWLRETHNIHPNIIVEAYGPCATYRIDRIFDGYEEKWVDFKSDENPSNLYSKREEACEAVIKYCLENLI
jgi:hypothetical protein